MLAAEPELTPWRIWERLLDEHDADVSYSTVRDYLIHRRPQPAPTSEET
jgi:hypothetical protein